MFTNLCSECGTDRGQCPYCIDNPMYRYIPKTSQFTPKREKVVLQNNEKQCYTSTKYDNAGRPLYRDLGNAEISIEYDEFGELVKFVLNSKTKE